jgi:FkbM family methyltransferase
MGTAALASRLPPSLRRLAGRVRRARQTLEFRVWRAFNGRGGRKTISVYGGHRIAVNIRDFRAYRIWRLGGSQGDKVRLVAALCKARPGLFIDVGANYGEFSLIPAALGVPCLAIEANPGVAACLRETFAGRDHVQIVEAAAGSASGTTTFFFCDSATGSGSLARDIPAGEAQGFSAITHARSVRAVTLDELAAGNDAVRAHGLVLKIDVEGFEREVLEGAEHLLGRAPWWRALLEFSPSCLRAAGKDVGETWAFFRRYRGAVDPAGSHSLAPLPEQVPMQEIELLLGSGALPAREAA